MNAFLPGLSDGLMKRILSISCALAFSPLVAFAGDKPASALSAEKQTGAVPSISHDDLLAAIKDKSVVIIDVNGSESYKDGRIPGAIDFAATKDLATALPTDKSSLIVAYCGSEACGAYKRAAKAALALGYTNVKHYSPGIKGWRESNSPIETGDKS
ncbi:MAG TPA: rhodanese-like domain-containing protein [Chthoniobacterales bacterium]